MRKMRPTIVLVVAILHFVGGGLGVTGGLCGLAFQGMTGGRMFTGFNPPSGSKQGMSQDEMQKQMENIMAEKMPWYREYQLGSGIVNVLISSLMIVSGIGLLMMRSWGRYTSIAYAVLSLLNHVFTIVYSLTYVVPATQAMFDEMARQEPQIAPMVSTMKMFTTLGALIPILLALYPLFVLIVMLVPSVAASFRSDAASDQELRDDFDEPEESWGKRRGRRPDDHIPRDDG